MMASRWVRFCAVISCLADCENMNINSQFDEVLQSGTMLHGFRHQNAGPLLLKSLLSNNCSLAFSKLLLALSRISYRHILPRSAPVYLASPTDNGKDGDDDEVFSFAALQARQEQLDQDIVSRWRKQPTRSWRIEASDWVRRLALDWPRVAYGTASGRIHIASILTGDDIAFADAHPDYVPTLASQRDMALLFGRYDGGGVIAIAIRDQYVVSAGRDGGATLWRVPESTSTQNLLMINRLVPGSQFASGPNGQRSDSAAVVSSIQTTSTNELLQIWTADLGGYLRRWDFDTKAVRDYDAGAFSMDAEDAECVLAISVGSPVLAIAVLEERRVIACGTDDGSVELFALDTGESRGKWLVFPEESVRSIAFVPVKVGEHLRHCLVVGGNAGTLRGRFLVMPQQSQEQKHINLFDSSTIDLPPEHGGSVPALIPLGNSRAGLFASGSIDGLIFIRELIDTNASDVLYGIGGHKVWFGSLATDGSHLVTDGADNSVLVYDYSDGSE